LDTDIGTGKEETDPRRLFEVTPPSGAPQPLLENFEVRQATPAVTAREININRIFGRRFKPVYMRWLSASEI
jgi:hypothetical protein